MCSDDEADLNVGVEPVQVGRLLRHLAVGDAIHDAFVRAVRTVRTLEELVAREALGDHLADDADVLVVAERLLDLKVPACASGSRSKLVDDCLLALGDSAHRGGNARHTQDGVVRQQRAITLVVSVTVRLLDLFDQLQVLFRSHEFPLTSRIEYPPRSPRCHAA